MKDQKVKYWDLKNFEKRIKVFNILIGGRGIGKTDSSLRYVMDQEGRFLYMRNTDAQLEKTISSAMNPFKKLNARLGYNIRFESEKDHYNIVSGGDPENDVEPNLIGYGFSLSTFDNFRGSDFSDVTWIVIDEFIQRRRLAFDQYKAFCEMYETVNRNRELDGEEPVKVLFLSNSQQLYNDILQGFNWVGIIETMLKNNQFNYSSPDVWICLCKDQNISDLKSKTVLYRNMPDDDVKEEFINNQFSNNDFSDIGKPKVTEYYCICSYDGMYILKHKSKPLYYITWVRYSEKRQFKDNEKLKFLKHIGLNIRSAYYRNRVLFQDMTIKYRLLQIIDK